MFVWSLVTSFNPPASGLSSVKCSSKAHYTGIRVLPAQPFKELDPNPALVEFLRFVHAQYLRLGSILARGCGGLVFGFCRKRA